MTEADIQIETSEWEGFGMNATPSLQEVEHFDRRKAEELKLREVELQQADWEGFVMQCGTPLILLNA